MPVICLHACVGDRGHTASVLGFPWKHTFLFFRVGGVQCGYNVQGAVVTNVHFRK